ncbi:MAG: hypothetical protein EHM72_15045, partial [Calditrichaeota bacterium]
MLYYCQYPLKIELPDTVLTAGGLLGVNTIVHSGVDEQKGKSDKAAIHQATQAVGLMQVLSHFGGEFEHNQAQLAAEFMRPLLVSCQLIN